MKAFICVYRHPRPHRRAWENTEKAAREDSLLRKFLHQYQNPDCYYDWGDDPSFFAARELLRNTSAASWGVCRTNVRSKLSEGDFVVFFCARQDPNDPGIWDYYLIGCATVEYCIERRALWSDQRFRAYRPFYNVLARVQGACLVQHEIFHFYHDDWERRAGAPYILFNPSGAVTRVNIDDPLHVARKGPKDAVELWLSDGDKRVRALENLLFRDLRITRRLRIPNNPRIPHPFISLHNAPGLAGSSTPMALEELRSALLGHVG